MFNLPKNISQKGTASLVVVAILLAGITVAVYLTQTGTSFLPQAQEANLETIFENSNTTCTNAAQGKPEGYYFISNATGCDIKYTLISKGASNEGSGCNLAWKRELMDSRCSPSQNAPAYWDCTEAVQYFGGSGQSYPQMGSKLSNCPNTQTAQFSHLDGATRWCTWKPAQCPTQQQQQQQQQQPPTAPAVAPPATAGQANGISSTACSTQQKQLCDTESWQPKGGCVITTTGLRQCKYEANREGDRCNNDPAHPETGAACGSKECRVIDGLPRCITNTCTEGEKTMCQSKDATCEIGTKKIDGVDKNYTYCKPGSSGPAAAPATQPTAQRPPAGAPAAPQSNTGQRPQSAQAPSTTKTPWDNDADNNKSLQNIEVLKYAARATSGSTDNASDAIDAARKARAAYLNGFDEGYSKVYIGKTISNDADARKERDIQANFVAIHAYIAKEFPGVSWEEAKQKGYDKRALDNLRRAETGWVIPQNATVDLSQIKAPNAVPTAGTPSTPQRLTIDPTVAVNCGTDLDGTQIPCYQIGVFASFDDLKATEAQASIATQRYAKSQEILTAAKGKVDEAILAAAQAKLDAAKAKAAACMPK